MLLSMLPLPLPLLQYPAYQAPPPQYPPQQQYGAPPQGETPPSRNWCQPHTCHAASCYASIRLPTLLWNAVGSRPPSTVCMFESRPPAYVPLCTHLREMPA
jgi:hypothetical protein